MVSLEQKDTLHVATAIEGGFLLGSGAFGNSPLPYARCSKRNLMQNLQDAEPLDEKLTPRVRVQSSWHGAHRLASMRIPYLSLIMACCTIAGQADALAGLCTLVAFLRNRVIRSILTFRPIASEVERAITTATIFRASLSPF